MGHIPLSAKPKPAYSADMMDMDAINTMGVEELRQIEQSCIERFVKKAQSLRDSDPTLTRKISHAKAASLLPQTMSRYLSVCSRLSYSGHGLKQWM